MQNLISIIPLTFDSSKTQIETFVNQIGCFGEKLDVIVVLENNDIEGFKNWSKFINQNPNLNFILEKLKGDFSSKGTCLNRAIKICKSAYFIRCDMDDEIYQYRFQETKNLILKSKVKIDLIYSDLIDRVKKKLISYPDPKNLSFYSIWRNPIPAPTICIRKEFMIQNKITYPPYNRCEDFFIVLKFIDQSAKILKISKPLVGYENNNLLKRDYKNWIKNAQIRFNRKRYDLIGIFSFIFGILILIYGILKYFYDKLILK